MNAAPAGPVVAMRGIGKSFPGVRALGGVDFEVGPAEIVALVGENGAGKSTLMNVLGGIHQPDEGSIMIDGGDVRIPDAATAIRLGIGFIHQECDIPDNLDIAGCMFLGREPLKGGPLRLVDRRRLRSLAEPWLRRLGSDLDPGTPIAGLATAHRQTVEIARALSQEGRILIMDEPTSSLTGTETENLFRVIREIRTAGVSVIYVSHRLAEVEALANRVVVLRDGRNAGELGRGAIGRDAMVRLMVGRDLVRTAAERREPVRSGGLRVEGLRTAAHPETGVDFEARRGEIIGFAGLVGAGRSEMARALFGVEPRAAGRFYLDGRELAVASVRDAIDAGVCLAPEDRRGAGVIVDMAVRENITLPGLETLAPGGLIDFARERIVSSEQCRALDIRAASLDAPVATLSGGNQQKVVLARWLSLAPEVMIFDEPTRGVDVGAKAEIYGLMRALAAKGAAVLMISSDMEEIVGVSDRVAVMCEGAIAGVLERGEISEERILRLATGDKA